MPISDQYSLKVGGYLNGSNTAGVVDHIGSKKLSTQTILAQIAPQRSSQYATLASTLAPSELLLSSIGSSIKSSKSRLIGNQEFLQLELENAPSPNQLRELATLSMTNSFYCLYEEVGGQKGPFLKPLETIFFPRQAKKLTSTRRYKGKTNELFTHWLCNLAKFSSKFSNESWESIVIVDPLSGGGTTLMTALVLGAGRVGGIEQREKDVKSTVAFFKQFAKEERIPLKVKEERLKKIGKRWTIDLGEDKELRKLRLKAIGSSPEEFKASHRRKSGQELVLAQGDTTNAIELLPSFRPHLMVGDLPYGIHHQGKLVELLDRSVPVWSKMLRKGGAVALSWDATRFSKEEMQNCLEKQENLNVLKGGVYDTFGHRVDRVIKNREVIILRK